MKKIKSRKLSLIVPAIEAIPFYLEAIEIVSKLSIPYINPINKLTMYTPFLSPILEDEKKPIGLIEFKKMYGRFHSGKKYLYKSLGNIGETHVKLDRHHKIDKYLLNFWFYALVIGEPHFGHF